jgi:hypothetical protein
MSRSALRGILFLAPFLCGGCLWKLIPEAEDKDEAPEHLDPKTSNSRGTELDTFFEGISFGNKGYAAPEKFEGAAPTSTGESDAPVIDSVPRALRLGPERQQATVPVRFSDVTRLMEEEAPNRLIVKLRGVDWRWWEYPVDPKAVIANQPEGYVYQVWLRGGDWSTLSALGPQVLELGLGESSGSVGAFAPIELSVTEAAVPPYEGLDCQSLAARFTREGSVESFGGSYYCSGVDGNLLCRTSEALDARCASADPTLQAPREPGDAVELASAPRGTLCRPSRNLIPYEYDDMTGMPFDPRPWEETLGTNELQGCASMLTTPGEPDDVWTGGYLCCP